MKISDLVIYENNDFVVLNKPSGLLSIPDREGKDISLKKLLQEKYNFHSTVSEHGGATPAISVQVQVLTVHRLDRGTSGLIVFAKNEAAHKFLSQQFEGRGAGKIYLGLVVNSPLNKKGTIDAPIMEHPVKKGFMVVNRKGKESFTTYEVLEDFGIYAWIRFQIFTGRTHQIRVHMKHIGHPVVCDDLYGDDKPVFLSSIKPNFKLSGKDEEERPLLNRLALHAWQLKFSGPDGNQYQFEAPVPKDLRATLQQLSRRKRNT